MATIFKHALLEPYLLKSHGWRAISDTYFDKSVLNITWWRVISKNCFDTSVLKIVGGEVASISKQTFFDEYEFKIPLWRGGEPFLTLALKYHS